MKNEEFSWVEIIWVLLIIILASYAIYYYYKNSQNNSNDADNIYKYEDILPHIESQKKNSNVNFDNTNPPKLTNLYNEDHDVIHSKNDIDIINKSTMLLYNDGYISDNPTFETELINTNTGGNFSNELEKVYTQDLVENIDTDKDYNEIFDYCVKPNKGDLPIANVPLFALKDTSCSLKLSDSFISSNN